MIASRVAQHPIVLMAGKAAARWDCKGQAYGAAAGRLAVASDVPRRAKITAMTVPSITTFHGML